MNSMIAVIETEIGMTGSRIAADTSNGTEMMTESGKTVGKKNLLML